MGCAVSTPADVQAFAEPPMTGGGAADGAAQEDASRCAASDIDGRAVVRARDQDAPGAPPAKPGAAAARSGSGSGSGRVGSMRLRSNTRAALHLEFLNEIQGLQQQMALVNDNALMGLQEAAELLSTQLGADLIAFWVITKQQPACSVLMAAHGDGAPVLQRTIVSHPPPPGGGAEDAPRLGAPVGFSIEDVTAEGEPNAGVIPSDLWAGPPALRSFVQVPIGAASAPMGALLLAKREPGAFSSNWWQVRLHVASTGLLPHVRHAQVEAMAHLLRTMDETLDPVALISVLLRSAARYMLKTCSMRMSVRLALLQNDKSGKALLFEVARPKSTGGGSGSGGSGAPGSPRSRFVAPDDAAGDVVASYMALPNTLLASAVSQQQARFISDCGQYMQTCMRPARDVFTRSSELVASIVVVPLIAGDNEPLGALYFALDAPCEFANIQDTLLGFISGVTPMLHNKLAGRAELLAAILARLNRRMPSQPLSVTDTSSHDLPSVLELPSVSSSEGDSAPSEAQGGGPAKSGRLSKIGSSQRLNTDAMLQVLQQQIRSKSRASSAQLTSQPELTVGECLGRGGFGVVYRGRWHRVPVAVKVMPSRNSEREAMQDAVEMAVLSTVQHPNIVSVYSCLTDMVEAAELDASLSGSLTSVMRTRYRRLRPDEDPEGEAETFNVVVMELCDRGTLRDAIKGGLVHRALPNGAIGVELAAAVEILLDVAYAVQYLHSMQLVHGDIKLENILLKSDTSRGLGGHAKGEGGHGRRPGGPAPTTASTSTGAGTVTHLAPEMFRAGTRITKAVDAYAFGVLMWEAYTSKRAYAGLPREAVIERVYKTGLRPRFPSTAPPAFAGLAEACWQSDPARRPVFAEIAQRLEALAAELIPVADGSGGP
ncbi:MAG: kinase-like domain-containing protein [Monoraphidium minutum]|nr:MAG: kinase-like domain-containing protein [Monoraphidium minutum]